ncbi:MAG: glutathione S-transferase family protein [Pseudomonadales bacterium]
MILFNYNLSPYAEKIRLMLGCSGLSWVSVKVPPLPPRKGLDELTGGYNRIPVAQSGADIFCDTKIIASEIAASAGRPEFALETCAAEVATFARSIEQEKFFAAVRAVPSKAMLVRALKEHLPTTLMKLMKDRAKMGRAAKVRLPSPAESLKIYSAMLADLDQQLADDFFFGDRPTNADFSAYHLVWFNVDLGKQEIPQQYSRLRAWYKRMSAFGHGNVQRKSMYYALQQASDNEPRAIASDEMASSNARVSIRPDDYRLDAVQGELVGESSLRWIIARDGAKCGRVHVHFPKEGFSIG